MRSQRPRARISQCALRALCVLLPSAGCDYTVNFPGDTEVTDVTDTGCDAPTSWYLDGDGDGLGAGDPEPSCTQPDGYALNSGDCDDGEPRVRPGLDEIVYNGLDDDCDPETGDDDLDGDGFILAEDCQDNDPEVNPDAEEICGDGRDNDCDGGGNGCQPLGIIDLDDADTKLLGEAGPSGLGGNGAWVGDVDGDGLDDVLMGAPTWSGDVGESAGAAYLLYSAPRGLRSVSEADARIEGRYAGQNLSGLIAGLGDINGDGFDDLVLGSKARSDGSVQSSGGADVGPAYVFFGGGLIGEVAVEGADVVIDNDAAAGVFLGAEAGGPVDFDGDGLGEVLLGAWRLSGGGVQDGAAYLFEGDGLTSGTMDEADWKLLGEDSSAAIQYSVGALGDFDGDGRGDVVVGAPKSDVAYEDAGAVYLVRGGLPPGEYPLGEAADHALYGEFSLAEVGRSVSGAGDVNGDGYEDLLIGSWEQETEDGDERYEDAGAVYLVYGPLGERAREVSLASADAKLLGYQTELWIGRPVGPAGDVDGDSYGDFVIGGGLVNPNEPPSDSRAFVVMGPVQSGTWLLNAMPGVGIFREERQGDWGGSYIAGLGDINGDGLDDLAVGASNEGTREEEAGAVYLFMNNGI